MGGFDGISERFSAIALERRRRPCGRHPKPADRGRRLLLAGGWRSKRSGLRTLPPRCGWRAGAAGQQSRPVRLYALHLLLCRRASCGDRHRARRLPSVDVAMVVVAWLGDTSGLTRLTRYTIASPEVLRSACDDLRRLNAARSQFAAMEIPRCFAYPSAHAHSRSAF